MIVSVIVPDRTIVIDGAALVFDFAAIFPGLRALQWNGNSGTLEFMTGPQQYFDNPAFVNPFIAAYQAEAQRVAAAVEAGAVTVE